MNEVLKQWAEDVSKAYDVLAFAHTERALEILAKTRTSLRQAIAELESQEPVVTVPRRLALNTWAFLAQDCSPCAHKECQIGLKNVGVDTLTDAWNKQLAGNTHPPQRTWVGLTDEEISGFTQHEMSVVKYVNKVLQEKNT